VTAEALSLLMAHAWPGNIRELENTIERSFILCNEGFIGIEHLPEELTARGRAQESDSNMRAARELMEVQSIRSALERNAFNRLAAAKELGIHKSTLFRKLKKLGISPTKIDGRSSRLQKE
jgi:transcriptional regulator with PAS, ATPase and Fis domain